MRLPVLAAFFLGSAFGQVVITNTGSTNMPGLSVTMGSKGHAVAERRGTKVKLNLQSELHARLMQDLEAAGPLDQLTVRHCAKSVSFGTSTFVTYKSVRSPDISCGGQSDPAVAALQKDVEEIIRQAHEKLPVERFGRSNRMIEKQ
jgi:hypothetical protein